MNILITAPSLNPNENVSGVSTMVNNIISHNKSHTYFHYLLGKSDRKQNKIKWLVKLIKQLVVFPFFVKKNKIELVHQNLPFDLKGVLREFVINLWCRFLKKPVVLHIHGGSFIVEGTNNKILKVISQSLFFHSKNVIVLSELEKVMLKEKFDYPLAEVLSNCIDTTFSDIDVSKIGLEKPVFLFLGRVEEDKGIYELLESLKLLKKEFNFSFVLCGSGTMKDYCIRECEEIFGNDFEYKGIVYGDDKINIIKNSSFFLLPSYFEGLPMALLETMAAGVVPIVTSVGSMKFIINDGVNGLLVQKKNSQDLYQKLKYVLTNQLLYNFMSDNARKTIEQKYDIKNYIRELNKIYTSANSNIT